MPPIGFVLFSLSFCLCPGAIVGYFNQRLISFLLCLYYCWGLNGSGLNSRSFNDQWDFLFRRFSFRLVYSVLKLLVYLQTNK
ncbi:hypothetical protein RchiOBHm_Chr2g0096471 [Rosa chinensis]|uniref:Uncharacterized protein n=1 Tax=Rosa chinensis TaxID=74649 RepID=A0A2P6RL22_ROSCH|nr:hypothetical protein RchiOBHm_Chr2g0096471 [Rosa chinensis]